MEGDLEKIPERVGHVLRAGDKMQKLTEARIYLKASFPTGASCAPSGCAIRGL
jgi:hypothetical protein